MSIQINPILSPRIITVPEIDGDSITIQSLVNQIRNWEDNQANLAYDRLLSATGKEDLGNEIKVGITAKLENAKVKFAERLSPVVCYISGGNLVAIDEYGATMYPIEFSANVTVILAQSSSATIMGVSGLASEESAKLMGIPSTTLTQEESETLTFLKASIRNKKYLEKVGSTWYFAIRDGSEESDIVRKALKDKDGNDVTDIQAGVLTREMASSV